MNILIYKYGVLLHEAEYIEDTNDGIKVKIKDEEKRLIMDCDYNYIQEVDPGQFSVMYFDMDGTIRSRFLDDKYKESYINEFDLVPTIFQIDNWLKGEDAKNQKI
jgi:hypothetical protein